MPLLNKDEFLAYNLTPMPTLETQENCSVCYDVYTRPVRTTCNHTFCAECLTHWLKNADTCPMCRAQLFAPMSEETVVDSDSDEEMEDGDADGDDNDDDQDHPGQSLYRFGIRWPQGIEPFNITQDIGITYPRGDYDMLDHIEDFDIYRHEVEAFGIHPLIDNRPGRHEVHVDVDHLFSQAAGSVYRLSSNPTLNPGSFEDNYIHGLCRVEWLSLLRKLKVRLIAIAAREAARRGRQWPGPSAFDLYNELSMVLHEFPRMEGSEFFSGDELRAASEVMGFRGKVDELVRWVVTQAVRENWRRLNDPDYEDDAPADWWVGMADFVM